MVYNPRDVLPPASRGENISSKDDLSVLGAEKLQEFRQYWQERKRKYLQELDITEKAIKDLDGKSIIEVKTMAEKDGTAFCNCGSCIYATISQVAGEKSHIDCPLIPMFIDTDNNNGPFICIENTSAPLCGIVNSSSNNFIDVCVEHLKTKCEYTKRFYNYANDCMVYLDGIIHTISSTPG